MFLGWREFPGASGTVFICNFTRGETENELVLAGEKVAAKSRQSQGLSGFQWQNLASMCILWNKKRFGLFILFFRVSLNRQ